MAASTYFDQIQQLYIAYFGRPADPVGLAYWAANVDAANGSVAQVIAGFSASSESQVLYSGATTAQKVSSIYLALFNRNPEAAGLAYWVAQIDSGSVSQAQAAYQIESSAGPGDATSIANKLSAAKAFTAQLDTPAEIAGYVGATAATLARAFLGSVDATSGSLANATGAVALANSVAVASNTSITTTPTVPTIPIPTTPQIYTLTAGADAIPGGTAADAINSTIVGGFDKGDVIDGGAGTDTLTVTGSGSISSAGVTVTNVEIASFTSLDSVALNTTGWTGLTSLTTQANGASTVLSGATGTAIAATVLNRGSALIDINGGANVAVTASGATTGTTTVGATQQPTGTVTISNSAAVPVAMGSITVKGGTTVNVTQVAASAVVNATTTLGSVTVTGGAATTAVTLNNTAAAIASVSTAGVTTNSVTIIDVNAGNSSLNGTISSVSLSNVSTVAINDTALTTLSIQGGSGNIIIGNGGLKAPTNQVLTLTLDGQTGGTLSDANVYTTLNLTTVTRDSTLANISDSALTTLAISGSNALTLTSAAGLSALQTVKVSGMAGLTGDLSGATVTSVVASDTTGNLTVSIDGSKASYNGGSGIDTVTLTATPTHTISGAGGTSDVVKIDASLAAGLSNAALVSGFEQLTLTGATNQTVDVSNFVGATTISTAGGNALVLSGLVSGNTLQLTGAGTGYLVSSTAAFVASGNDTLNLKLTDGSGVGINFATGGITTSDIENIVISVNDTQSKASGTFLDSVGLLGNTTHAITVSGNAGLNLTATGTGITSVDASGITTGGFTWTSGALTGTPITVKGSANGANVIDLSAATKAVVTYTEGLGANTITTGSGDDIVTLGWITAGVTVNFGTGHDRLTLTGIPTQPLGFITTTGLGAGDIVAMAGASGGAHISVQSNLGAMLTGQTTLAGYMDLAASAVVRTGNNAVLHWFQFGGDTYITQDTSALLTYLGTYDTTVKLTGLLDLSTSIVAAGVVTL
ncbi:beta strand repeat-containing protein [Pseudomonas syringae]|uniref:DUF4214 domain-containing protein n=1 Tax=Pseudomonas syringae TaxID=317 RepID=A0A085UL82_PSESX|nr:DUF4214 domain-containing protein [Pseudomonas syringae]KFE43945.1 hypothetical protein IV02_31360 [Pseudomonas syringae]